jgi:hypothetical protein
MLLGCLERFGGYTLSTLLEEDVELIRLLKIQELGNPEKESAPDA